MAAYVTTSFCGLRFYCKISERIDVKLDHAEIPFTFYLNIQHIESMTFAECNLSIKGVLFASRRCFMTLS